MTIVVEDGTGIFNANAYVSVAYASEYFTLRSRSFENNWIARPSTEKEAAIISATDYIESRWGPHFRGKKRFVGSDKYRATFTLSDIPAEGDKITIDGADYVYGEGVEIGQDISFCLDSLSEAVNRNGAFSTYRDLFDKLVFEYGVPGVAGKGVQVSSNFSSGVWSSGTLIGTSSKSQPLSFPREFLYGLSGEEVVGVPTEIMKATAEYAIRAVSSFLAPDPFVDNTSRVIKIQRKRVGPIETETEYQEGANFGAVIRSYPAADLMVSKFTRSPGVYR
jgi:hypothetical protein